MRRPFMRVSGSGLLDLLQQAEHGARRAHKQAFESLGQATTLERVATGATAFCHGYLQSEACIVPYYRLGDTLNHNRAYRRTLISSTSTPSSNCVSRVSPVG